MSGIAPYVFLELLGGNLVALGPSVIQYIYDGSTHLVIPIVGTDFFQAGCMAAVPQAVGSQHPINSYNTSYPYCRTAVTYRMDDPRRDPQLGQFVVAAPFLSIKVLLAGCDRGLPISVSYHGVQPSVSNCAVGVYPGFDPTEFYIQVERARVTLPARINFTITNGTRSKAFWIGLRDRRDGTPSGAVI
jgi:hypothetical protein